MLSIGGNDAEPVLDKNVLDSYRCRFIDKNGTTPKQVVALLGRVTELGLEVAMTENLRNYDGKPGFTLAQGQ